MPSNKEISDKNLEAVAGGKETNVDEFTLEVEYVVFGTGPTSRGEKHEMSHWVKPDETIGSIETKTCESCNATITDCQTFYHGRLLDKSAVIGELGVSPAEKLTMFIHTS